VTAYSDWWPVTLPLLILAIAAAFGAGVWLCALTVKYRDFRCVPFIVQFGCTSRRSGSALDSSDRRSSIP
jgi:ABC-type polysaccharide/polyol phosphate export permease